MYPGRHFQTCLISALKTRSIPLKCSTEVSLALSENIRLSWKGLSGTKHSNLFSPFVKSSLKHFITLSTGEKIINGFLTKRLNKRERLSVANLSIPTCGLYYKSLTIVNYDHNDNGLYYNTTIVSNLTMIVANLTAIVANLALVRSVNYDCKVRCKQKCTFTIINYYPKPFIVHATVLILESTARLEQLYTF